MLGSCCAFHYLSGTDLTKPIVLFSKVVGSPYFERIHFQDYMWVTTAVIGRFGRTFSSVSIFIICPSEKLGSRRKQNFAFKRIRGVALSLNR